MKQLLGDKKRRRCEQILGRPVRNAYVRGGWDVGVAQCWVADNEAWWVDFKHGEVVEPVYGTATHPERPIDPVEQEKLDQMKRILTAVKTQMTTVGFKST